MATELRRSGQYAAVRAICKRYENRKDWYTMPVADFEALTRAWKLATARLYAIEYGRSL